MFKITCDGTTIYDPRVPELAVLSGKITLELNKAGSFVFKLPPEHTYYDLPQKMASKVIVYWDDTAIFYGRCTEEAADFWNRKEVTCEGELAYLNDTIQRPGEYHDITPREYLETLIASHNAEVDEDRQFTVGIVTITDSNDSIYRYTNYNSTMEEIKADLVDDLGGYLKVRNENGYRYLDYVELEDYGDTSSQGIEFGENLLDFTRNVDVSDIATAIIPLGAKLDESSYTSIDERLTIADVNDGSDCIQNDEAVETYGFICKTVTWDSVTTAEYLLSKATAYLEDYQFENMVIEASALDLHYTDDDVMRLKLGDKVRVKSAPHGMDRYFYISAMTVDLLSPSSNTITLGIDDSAATTLTAAASSISSTVKTNANIQSTFLSNAIAQATALITASTHGYVMLNDIDDDGEPDELVIMDTDDTETATNVWRWNLNGLGYSSTGYNGTYGTAITMDGTIVGTYIAAGTVGAEQLSVEYIESVETEISNAILTAEEYADDELTNYYTIATLKQELTAGGGELDSIIALTYATKTEVSDLETTLSSEISQTESSILLTVSETYATQSDLASAQETLEASITVNANAISAEVTRATEAEETLSASITATESSILLTVSETYATQSDLTSAIEVSESSILSTVSSTYATASSVSTLSTTLTQTASSLEASIEDTQSNVRTYFAADTTSITVSSGVISFTSDTISITSDYFTLTSTGKLTASSVSLSGEFTTDNDSYWVTIDDGSLTCGLSSSTLVRGYVSIAETSGYMSIGGYSGLILGAPNIYVSGYSQVGALTGDHTGQTVSSSNKYMIYTTSTGGEPAVKSLSVGTALSQSKLSSVVTSLSTSTLYYVLTSSYYTGTVYLPTSISYNSTVGAYVISSYSSYSGIPYNVTRNTLTYYSSYSTSSSALSSSTSLTNSTLYYLYGGTSANYGLAAMTFTKGLLTGHTTY